MPDPKIRKIGNAHAVVLPEEVMAQLRGVEGDPWLLTKTPDGGDRITPYDPEFECQRRLAETGMARYRRTLRALAR